MSRVETDSIALRVEVGTQRTVFRAADDYDLQKTGVGAYKLTFGHGRCDRVEDVRVPGSGYAVVCNANDLGGLTGLLLLMEGTRFRTGDAVFSVCGEGECPSDAEGSPPADASFAGFRVPRFAASNDPPCSKTSLFDKYHVESRRASEQR